MQFWIIDRDPAKNAQLLPNMALMTNIREGWQILSDIGYLHNVKWKGQNRQYSVSHPTTRMHCVNKLKFIKFDNFYKACLIEYKRRFHKELRFHMLYEWMPNLYDYISQDRTEEQFQLEYLLTKKFNKAGKQQISSEELIVLEEKLNEESVE